jgi:hypothetical protein
LPTWHIATSKARIVALVHVEQLETPDGVTLRSSPTPQEWQRARARLVIAAAASVVSGAALSIAELKAGVNLPALEVLPIAVGMVWAVRFIRTFQRARPTAVILTDHSVRLERLDGTRREDLDLGSISSIRIGPDGFALPWRWLKGPRSGLVIVRLRASGQGLAIPPQIAGHPVVHHLLARMLATSRARGHVDFAGPRSAVSEIENLAGSTSVLPATAGHVPPITIPAGWYADPSGQAPSRWWDGREWTGFTRELPPSPPG